MIVEIDVQPETAALLAEAQTKGISLDIVLRSVLANGNSTHWQETATPAEWNAELRRWAGSHSHINAPHITDEALRRENLYTREDDII